MSDPADRPIEKDGLAGARHRLFLFVITCPIADYSIRTGMRREIR
jgi:hypothetical protein